MNNSPSQNQAARHRRCWELLPWLVNDTLPESERSACTAHLAECAQCRDELAMLQEVSSGICAADDQTLIAPHASWRKLSQRLDAGSRTALSDAGSRPGVRWPRWLAVAAAVQGLILVLLVSSLWRDAGQALHAPRFETLTTPDAAADDAVVRVVFASSVALSDAQEVIRSIDAQIVAGPSAAGVYTLALNERSTSEADLAALLSRLRSDPRVVFAEPAAVRLQ